MIFFSFGLPGAFADWCETVLVELARRKFGTVELVNANTPEELGESFIRTGASHMVFCSWFPSTGLCKLLAESKCAVLLHLDDPGAAVAFLVSQGGHDALGATRAIAQSYASLARCLGIPNLLTLTTPQRVRSLGSIRDLNRAFNLMLPEAELADIWQSVAQREALAGLSTDSSEKKWDDRLPAIIGGVSQGYATLFESGKLSSLVWRRELFLIGDRDAPVTGPIDLTGRSRYLIRGPYIRVPPGSWTARIVFGCSKEAVGLSLLLDVCAGTQLCQTRMRPTAHGVFEVDMRFSIDDANDHPIDVRIFSEKASLEGFLSLSHVTLVPETEPDLAKHAALTAELGLNVQ